MTFEEIFNEDGLYASSDFAEGYCFQIKEGVLFDLSYEHKNDLTPFSGVPIIRRSLLKKDYSKVYTRQSLFK